MEHSCIEPYDETGKCNSYDCIDITDSGPKGVFLDGSFFLPQSFLLCFSHLWCLDFRHATDEVVDFSKCASLCNAVHKPLSNYGESVISGLFQIYFRSVYFLTFLDKIWPEKWHPSTSPSAKSFAGIEQHEDTGPRS